MTEIAHREREGTTAVPWGAIERTDLVRSAADENLAAGLARELASAWRACGEFEWVALGYLSLSAVLIAVFHANLAHPLLLVSVQACVAAVILALCGSYSKSQAHAEILGETWASRNLHFWRHWYPHLFFLFCFEEMSRLVHLVYPGWHDAKLIAFDRWLTGVNPPLWLERFAQPALNEFMQFAYFTYFLYLLILGGILYYHRDFRSYWEVMTYSAVGYTFGYVIAVLFPVQSPWFTMAGMWHGELVGGPFTAAINLIEKCGRVHGAAFPSQHVAGAVAALWGAWRHRRWLFWVFLPFVASMCVSTVYVRNHYVADVLGGLITGSLGYWLGKKILNARNAYPEL
ncbi:MAG TPA: phosphatase PAP2 family protein [Candidatus Acidoferrales bacterium]|nr:phosphatase PAP2 family protein [Candidatus Acidoferrales bacterium]